MTTLSNFQQFATYYVNIYGDNTVEYFNRRDFPIGLATKRQQLDTTPVKIKLSKYRVAKLKAMAEDIHGQLRVYLYTRDMNSPNLRPRSPARISKYFERKAAIDEIVLGL